MHLESDPTHVIEQYRAEEEQVTVVAVKNADPICFASIRPAIVDMILSSPPARPTREPVPLCSGKIRSGR